MGKNLLHDWINGEELDDVQFEKFVKHKNRENVEESTDKNDYSRERKVKEDQRWDIRSDE